LSIIKVESNFHPYAITVDRKGYYLSLNPHSYQQAVYAAYRFGDNIDLGYMQINYRYWGKKLGLTKAELLNPAINIQAGCYILYLLLNKYKNYTKAVMHYHSSNFYLGARYVTKVIRAYREITMR